MASSLDILKSLSSNVDNPNNPIQVELAQRARLDEMKRSLGMVSDTTGGMDKWGNPTGTSFSTGATIPETRSLSEDVSQAPYTGDAAQQAQTNAAVASRPDVQQMNAQAFAQKMGLAVAPNQAKAAGDVQVEQIKNQGLKDMLGMKQQGEQDLVKQFSGGQTNDGGTGPKMKMTVGPNGPTFSQIAEPNQVQQMAEGSADLLKMMPRAVQLADELQKAGIFTPLLGSLRQAAAGHGLSTLAGMGPDMAQKISEFNSLGSGMTMSMAKALAGARGAGNSGLISRFEKLAPMQGDLPSFIGGLKGMTDLLTQAASHSYSSDQIQQMMSQINPTGVGGSGASSVSGGNPSDPLGLKGYVR
jgi:hypothetical protein